MVAHHPQAVGHPIRDLVCVWQRIRRELVTEGVGIPKNLEIQGIYIDYLKLGNDGENHVNLFVLLQGNGEGIMANVVGRRDDADVDGDVLLLRGVLLILHDTLNH
jgi:hypothetical protein